MGDALTRDRGQTGTTSFESLARRIGRQLRDVYPHPESEQLPVEHVQMLLQLRQKERQRSGR
jgi:hypothetical protein